jgi:hypothetical protein
MWSLGWPIRAVARLTGLHGRTLFPKQIDGDVRERATEMGVILFAPALDDDSLSGGDFREVTRLVRAGVSLTRVVNEATRLLADPAFRQRVSRVERKLWAHPVMSGDELAEILN